MDVPVAMAIVVVCAAVYLALLIVQARDNYRRAMARDARLARHAALRTTTSHPAVVYEITSAPAHRGAR
jgi:hypothetical protein